MQGGHPLVEFSHNFSSWPIRSIAVRVHILSIPLTFLCHNSNSFQAHTNYRLLCNDTKISKMASSKKSYLRSFTKAGSKSAGTTYKIPLIKRSVTFPALKEITPIQWIIGFVLIFFITIFMWSLAIRFGVELGIITPRRPRRRRRQNWQRITEQTGAGGHPGQELDDLENAPRRPSPVHEARPDQGRDARHPPGMDWENVVEGRRRVRVD